MITKENYFQKVKFIKFGSLTKELQALYNFTEEATEKYTTWEHYESDKDVSEPVDKFFKALNEFLGSKKSEEVTEELALDCAKNLIRGYVHRGDSLESLASSHLGQSGGGYAAAVKSKKIEVTEVLGQKTDYSFSLEQVYNAVAVEKSGSAKPENKPATGKPAKKPKPAKPVKPTKPATKPAAKPKPKPVRINTADGKPVERLDEEIKYIRRFLNLHNRSKTRAQVLSFINALQRAILEKRIRKSSPYANEIMQIQKQLLTAHKVMRDGQVIQIGESTIKRLTEIAESYRVRFSTQYLKRFVGIHGKTITKEKADRLKELILKGLENSRIPKSDPYFKNIMNVVKSLIEFVEKAKPGETLAIHSQTLNGLNGILECSCLEDEREELDGIEPETEAVEEEIEPEKTGGGGMSINEVQGLEFEPVPIKGKWLELIGNFCLPTSFFIYGKGGSGKSSLALMLCDELASLGYKCLYVASEQYGTPTFTALVNRLNLRGGPNFIVTSSLNDPDYNPADFDFVALDSKDSLNVEVNDYLVIKDRYPKQSFIVVPHSIKTGSFRGKEQWRNVMEVMIECKDGVARTGNGEKNRWGGKGEFVIFSSSKSQQAA